MIKYGTEKNLAGTLLNSHIENGIRYSHKKFMFFILNKMLENKLIKKNVEEKDDLDIIIEESPPKFDPQQNYIISETNEPFNFWIAGGALTNYFSGNYKKSDVDFFTFNNEITDIIIETLENLGGKKILTTKNSIKYELNGYHYDVITEKLFSTPEETIKNFDFTVVCAAIDIYGNFVAHDHFFADLAKKALVINSLPYPLCTLNRVIRYVKKGYTICNGGLLELVQGIQTVNLEDSEQNLFQYDINGNIRFISFD